MINKNNMSAYSGINFSCKTFDFETKFAKFYKHAEDNVGVTAITKIFKTGYDSFFSERNYGLLKNISSDNLVKILHVNSDIDNKYVTYEYFESNTLKNWLQSDITIDKYMLFKVLLDMATIIDTLHKNNLAHLDIVGNFLINNSGHVKLSDYDYVTEINGSHIYKIDLHSYFELVYRLIFFIDKKHSTRFIKISYNDSNLNYSSCLSFIKSLSLR